MRRDAKYCEPLLLGGRCRVLPLWLPLCAATLRCGLHFSPIPAALLRLQTSPGTSIGGPSKPYDVIVVGAGIMGACTAYYVAK